MASMGRIGLALLIPLAMVLDPLGAGARDGRPRAREMGLAPGVFEPGPNNALTDVRGVEVGHFTLADGDVQTGVTAILPHSGNVYRQRVPAAIVVGNGFGKLVGVTQVQELGELETPILLTNTLAVWDAAAALVERTLSLPGNEDVRSVNPVVGETNDGWLNDIRARPLRREHFLAALDAAREGPVEEGSVGAGRGTRAFGYKGGIGTSSRRLMGSMGGYTVGVLVQSNYGGVLTMDGHPIGKALGNHPFAPAPESGDGSCMIVVATDAPCDARQLRRLAHRALAGMARTGSSFSHGSGDYVIAFSTAEKVRIDIDDPSPRATTVLPEAQLSGLFQAVIEATEEAIYNSLLQATEVVGVDGHRATPIPLEQIRAAQSFR